MTTATYTPRYNSLPWKVCNYFLSNPSEELSPVDIAFKFGCHAQGVQTTLASAVAARMLVRVRNADLEWVYGPGKAIDTLDFQDRVEVEEAAPTPAPVPVWPAAAPLPPVKPLPTPTPYVKPTHPMAGLPLLTCLPIDDNVPIPSIRGVGSDKEIYAKGVLSQLKPGQSIALPLSIKYVMSNAVTACHKAKTGTYTTRTFKDTETLRVWRVS